MLKLLSSPATEICSIQYLAQLAELLDASNCPTFALNSRISTRTMIDYIKQLVRLKGREINEKWRIHYRGESGELTMRTIEISHYYDNGYGYVLATCQLRREERCFRVSRIERAYDLGTSKAIKFPRLHLIGIRDSENLPSFEESLAQVISAVGSLVATVKEINSKKPPMKSRRRRQS